jgi:hypothetical protein
MMFAGPTSATSMTLQGAATVSTGSTEHVTVSVLEDESVTSNHPDANWNSSTYGGGIWVGYDSPSGSNYARAWLKYDLTFIPKEIGIVNVKINFYCDQEWSAGADLPVGIYYSDNDTWSETTITWNTQPDFDTSPADIIDSPAGSGMFVVGNWYSWDVTQAFTTSLNEDKLLTLVLKQVNETDTTPTWTYFVEKEFNVFKASYLSIEYTTPESTNLSVDGYSSAPMINYIQNSTPDLGWTMSGDGAGDYQRDYALEVNSNQYFNGTELWSVDHTDTVTVYDSSGGGNPRPFGTADEFRYQMKYDQSMLLTSGVVDKLHFESTVSSGTIIFENLLILMVSSDVAGNLTNNFAANYGSGTPVVVLNRSSYSASILNYYFTIDVENTFFLNQRRHLIIELRFTNNIGTLALTPITYDVGGSVAYIYGPGASEATTADYTLTRAHSLKVDVMSDEAQPTPGTITNSYPFATDNGHSGIIQWKYNQSLISKTGVIDRIFIPVSQFSGDVVYEGLKVYLAETPVLGPLSHTNFASNYGGVTPTLVLDRNQYTFRNIGGSLVLDVDNTFYYYGVHDLIIEMRWDNKINGTCYAYRELGTGGYRAYNLTFSSLPDAGNDTRTYDMVLDFVHDVNSVEYAGTPLVNTTTYYWRVKTCDSIGIWSEWTSSSFRYEVLTSTPEFDTPIVAPSPAFVGNPVSVSLNVTYFLGIGGVWLEMNGVNHSMVAAGDTYSYTWTPASAGNITYSIYMESNIGTWSSTDGYVVVVSPGLTIDPTILLLVIGAGLVAVVIIVVLVRSRGKK